MLISYGGGTKQSLRILVTLWPVVPTADFGGLLGRLFLLAGCQAAYSLDFLPGVLLWETIL
jgi:hypothetical protein